MLILVLIYANSLHLLYPVEPLSMLHEFCSGNLAGGILLLGIILFAAAPTLKRKILTNQTYIFTNRRAVAISASGCVLHSIPAEQITPRWKASCGDSLRKTIEKPDFLLYSKQRGSTHTS